MADYASRTRQPCLVCREDAHAEDIFFRWFDHETHASAETLNALRRSRGFCERHARRQILAQRAWRPTSAVVHEILVGALDALHGGTSREACPACRVTADHRRALLFTTLQGRRFDHGSEICLRHVREGASMRDREVVGGLRSLLTLLSAADLDSLGQLSGRDPDAPARQRLRDLHSMSVVPAGDPTERLIELLTTDTCSICRAVSDQERRHLEGISIGIEEDPDVLRRRALRVCDRHFHDLALSHGAVIPHLVSAQADWLRGETIELLERRLRARRPRTQPAADGVRSVCSVCAALTAVEGRLIELLEIALADSRVRTAYETSHGICLRHWLGLASRDIDDLVRSRLATRLNLFVWEVDEARRKSGLDARFEPPGGEANAWARALVQLDGRVTVGLPAAVALDQAAAPNTGVTIPMAGVTGSTRETRD